MPLIQLVLELHLPLFSALHYFQQLKAVRVIFIVEFYGVQPSFYVLDTIRVISLLVSADDCLLRSLWQVAFNQRLQHRPLVLIHPKHPS